MDHLNKQECYTVLPVPVFVHSNALFAHLMPGIPLLCFTLFWQALCAQIQVQSLEGSDALHCTVVPSMP